MVGAPKVRSEVLPRGDNEQQLLQGLLSERDKVEADMKHGAPFSCGMCRESMIRAAASWPYDADSEATALPIVKGIDDA